MRLLAAQEHAATKAGAKREDSCETSAPATSSPKTRGISATSKRSAASSHATSFALAPGSSKERVSTRDVQLLARQAAAWLTLEAHSPATRARRTLELARFCAAFHPLELGTRGRFLPEAWSLEEVLAMHDRAQHALGDAARSSPAPTEETEPHRPPPLPHEAAARHIPGFQELLDALLPTYGSPSDALHARRVREADLLAASDVRRFLAREHRRHLLESHSRHDARDRTRALGALLTASVNHALSLRKTFWVDDALAAKLEHTRLDVHGADLNLPFPSCAFVLTEPTALSFARQLIRLDPSWRQTERVSVRRSDQARRVQTPAFRWIGELTRKE